MHNRDIPEICTRFKLLHLERATGEYKGGKCKGGKDGNAGKDKGGKCKGGKDGNAGKGKGSDKGKGWRPPTPPAPTTVVSSLPPWRLPPPPPPPVVRSAMDAAVSKSPAPAAVKSRPTTARSSPYSTSRVPPRPPEHDPPVHLMAPSTPPINNAPSLTFRQDRMQRDEVKTEDFEDDPDVEAQLQPVDTGAAGSHISRETMVGLIVKR